VSKLIAPGVFLCGLILFGVGLWLAWPPLGLIGPGVVLMAVTVLGPRMGDQ
jgi:uncharacterized membrane protein YiaA